MEVERGGHWRFVEHTPGGPQGFEGRYGEVTPRARAQRERLCDTSLPGLLAASHLLRARRVVEDYSPRASIARPGARR